jgi:aspartyl-tRNA(Asn)/glutamyl-tRNA(Gln) amidotransferase subunit B
MSSGLSDIRIGLEIHARLCTESKAFCSCPNRSGDPPNTNVCPVCLGLPGTLPQPNESMVTLAVVAALAFSAAIHSPSHFSRKLYSYPDLPKGYQITQFDSPISTGGFLRYRGRDQGIHRLPLWRMHLEEDAAGLSYAEGNVHVDYNRSGLPLLEIVTSPALTQPEDAVLAAKELRRSLMHLGICDGRMAEGSFRCDVNVSITRDGRDSGRSEIKNLNSFAAMRRAMQWEIERRNEMTEDYEENVTLHWDEAQRRGEVMRRKESVHEYRFAGDPDLPPLHLDVAIPEKAGAALKELPVDREQRLLSDYGLSANAAVLLCDNTHAADYFEQTMRCRRNSSEPFAALAAKWLTGEIPRQLRAARLPWSEFSVTSASFADLLDLIMNETLSDAAARTVLETMIVSGGEAEKLAQTLGLTQIQDIQEIDRIIAEVLPRVSAQVDAWKKGRKQVFTYIMGTVLRHGNGRLHPATTSERLGAALETYGETTHNTQGSN